MAVTGQRDQVPVNWVGLGSGHGCAGALSCLDVQQLEIALHMALVWWVGCAVVRRWLSMAPHHPLLPKPITLGCKGIQGGLSVVGTGVRTG